MAAEDNLVVVVVDNHNQLYNWNPTVEHTVDSTSSSCIAAVARVVIDTRQEKAVADMVDTAVDGVSCAVDILSVSLFLLAEKHSEPPQGLHRSF